MVLVGLKDYQRFDAEGFLTGKELLLMGMRSWKDFQSGKVVGTKLIVIIWSDETVYKNNQTNNAGLEVEVKVPNLEAEKMAPEDRKFIKLVKPSGTIYGDFQNQLSLKAEGFQVVDLKKGSVDK